ncbi:MAG: thiol peroxidase [Corynebacterium sp.]|nr:thiol peroxidase [Corynebacterium sp.]
MTETKFQGASAHTIADLPEVGSTLDFSVVGTDLAEVSPADFAGKQVVLNIFPSIDTGVCAATVRHFNEKAANLDNTVVLCISKDLPFALDRFCGAEGIENVVATSAFRSDFGTTAGVELVDSPLQGLLARTVIVLDTAGKVSYVQLVPEITEEPDYDAVLAALA